MRIISTFIFLFFSLNSKAELLMESSITLTGHNPEKWGLKHIKAELGEGYFKFNELIDVKTTTGKISKKKYNEKLMQMKALENAMLKKTKFDSPVCNRKLIIETKQKVNSISNTYCLDNLKIKDLAMITKTIQQLKN